MKSFYYLMKKILQMLISSCTDAYYYNYYVY